MQRSDLDSGTLLKKPSHMTLFLIPSLAKPAILLTMRLQELVLCTTAPNSPESSAGYVFLHDIQNAANLASFKQTNAGNHCTAVFESTSRQGGFILAAQSDKSILNVYNFQKVSLLDFALVSFIHYISHRIKLRSKLFFQRS